MNCYQRLQLQRHYRRCIREYDAKLARDDLAPADRLIAQQARDTTAFLLDRLNQQELVT